MKQLKAEELRIGNLLDEKGEFFPVGKRTFQYWDQLNLSKVFKPIPLTEELLVKLGFFKSGFFYCKCLGIEHLNISLKHEVTTIGDIEEVSIEHIKHVHSLQNLYFALTGEELKLNQ